MTTRETRIIELLRERGSMVASEIIDAIGGGMSIGREIGYMVQDGLLVENCGDDDTTRYTAAR